MDYLAEDFLKLVVDIHLRSFCMLNSMDTFISNSIETVLQKLFLKYKL